MTNRRQRIFIILPRIWRAYRFVDVSITFVDGKSTPKSGKCFCRQRAHRRWHFRQLSPLVEKPKITETLVLAYKEEGLFDELGFASATFEDWTSAPLEPGMEMAQIDWDGSTTRVDWTVIQEIVFEEGVPRLVLADDTMVGASGGGVFLNGSHVANNWRLEERLDTAGNVVGGITTAALNSAQVLSLDKESHSEPSYLMR